MTTIDKIRKEFELFLSSKNFNLSDSSVIKHAKETEHKIKKAVNEHF